MGFQRENFRSRASFFNQFRRALLWARFYPLDGCVYSVCNIFFKFRVNRRLCRNVARMFRFKAQAWLGEKNPAFNFVSSVQATLPSPTPADALLCDLLPLKIWTLEIQNSNEFTSTVNANIVPSSIQAFSNL